MDLQSAYYQVRLKPEDVPKTTLTTQQGLYEYTMLCFGLTNAQGTFQAVMNDVQKVVRQVCLDDIVLFSNNAEVHMEHVRFVFEVLRKHKLYAKLPKCSFMQSELKFLGHIVGSQGLQVELKKVAIVQDQPVPAGVAQSRSFLGLANYFRKFVTGWATLVALLKQPASGDKVLQVDLEAVRLQIHLKHLVTRCRLLQWGYQCSPACHELPEIVSQPQE